MFPKRGQVAVPRALLLARDVGSDRLLLDAGIEHEGDRRDRSGDLRLGELGVGPEHGRRAGPQPDRDDPLGMKGRHHVGPDAAARMSPEDPGNGLQLRMARRGGEVAEGLQEGLLRAVPRVEPEFGSAGRSVGRICQDVIGGTEQGAIPFLRQRLPV